ncbi:MAG: hypothetical protein WA622_10190 [Mycobacterium sp.]|uniref:hypothetical protein n=1 Tax=Mycobacterium sp. TaxID=1785 RepID=UPI003C8C2E4E
MTAWATTIVVALIAAMATIFAANISSAHSRQNVRGRILQDLEIAAKLPNTSPAREILRTYAENRALLLPVEEHIRHIGFKGFWGIGSAVLIAATTVMAHGDTAKFWRIQSGILIWLAILVGYWLSFKRDRSYLIRDYLAEQDLPPTVEPAIEALVLRSYRPWLFRRWWRRRDGEISPPVGPLEGP